MQLEAAREMDEQRRMKYIQRGLVPDEVKEAFYVDSNTPFLSNMSDDALIAGCLVYHLPAGEVMAMGSAKDNNIVLEGLGIQEHLCRLSNTDNATVTVERLSEAGRVCINGRLLLPGEVKELHSGDRVYVGRAFAFRLKIPLSNNQNQEELSGCNVMEEECAALDDSLSWNSLQEYLEQVLAQMPEDHAQDLFQEIRRGCKLCDEANEITAELKPDAGLTFEVDLTSSVPSSIVIRVLQVLAPKQEGDPLDYNTLYLWSVPQLMERLERMRDHHTAMIRGQGGWLGRDDEPLKDPWHDPPPPVLSMQLRSLQQYATMEHEDGMQALCLKHKMLRKYLDVVNREERNCCMRIFFQTWASIERTAVKLEAIYHPVRVQEVHSTGLAGSTDPTEEAEEAQFFPGLTSLNRVTLQTQS